MEQQPVEPIDLRGLYAASFLIYFVYSFGTAILLRLLLALPVLLVGRAGIHILPLLFARWKPVARMNVAERFVNQYELSCLSMDLTMIYL